MEKLCEMCKVRGVCGEAIERSGPAVKYQNPVDKLTSTASWPTIYGKYCYLYAGKLAIRASLSKDLMRYTSH